MAKDILPIKLSDEQVFADLFLTLANESRMRILQFLYESPSSSVTSISEAAKVSQQRISDHLGILRRKDFIRFRKEGRKVFYDLNKNRIWFIVIKFLKWLDVDLEAYPFPIGRHLDGIDSLVNVLRVFASEGRCSIIRILRNEMLSVNEIQERVFLEQQTVSDHLQKLRKAGFVIAHKEGRFVKCESDKEKVVRFFLLFLGSFQ